LKEFDKEMTYIFITKPLFIYLPFILVLVSYALYWQTSK